MSTINVSNLKNVSAANPAFVLAADGSATANLSSLNGGPIAGSRNRIINGDMRIDQRNAGASVTPTNGQYTLDRWVASLSQSSKFSVQQSTTSAPKFSHSLLCTSLSAYTVAAGEVFAVSQYIEGLNASDLAWGTANASAATLSFWVRSSLTGTFGGVVTNNAQDRSYPFSYTISAANTWEQKSVAITGDTSGTWLTTNGLGVAIRFSLGAGSTYSGTAGAWSGSQLWSVTGATSVVGTNGATFYITGVQLEPGTVATPFERRSYGQELALCQRYYEVCGAYLIYSGNSSNGSTYYNPNKFAVAKRAVPTVTTTDVANANFPGGAPTVGTVATDGFYAQKTANATAGASYFQYSASASAEL